MLIESDLDLSINILDPRPFTGLLFLFLVALSGPFLLSDVELDHPVDVFLK